VKKYIIIGWAGKIGGGQLYTKNKCEVLTLHGWSPTILYSADEEIVIRELLQYPSQFYFELSFLPSYYSKRKQEQLLSSMINFLNVSEEDEVFIETNDVRYSYWGELLAKKLQCKHFVYLLEAYFGRKEDNIDFFRFKLERNELAGNRITSLPDLFANKVIITDQNNRYYRAVTFTDYEEKQDDLGIDYSSFDVKIGHVGRDTKPYVGTLYSQLESFAKRHRDKKILFLMIGGETNSIQGKRLKELAENYSNLSVICTGQIVPIPPTLVQNMDVCIGSSGCLRVIDQCGVRAIAYLDNGQSPCGVLGYDVKKIPVENIYGGSLEELLEEVLFKNFCENFVYKGIFEKLDGVKEKELTWKHTVDMLQESSKKFYDTSTILGPRKLIRIWQKSIGKLVPFGNMMRLLCTIKK